MKCTLIISNVFQLQLAGFRLHPGPLPEQYRTLLNQVSPVLIWLGLELLIKSIEHLSDGKPQISQSHAQSDQAGQVGSSKEKKAKNKKNKKHRGGGSETPAYEEGGRAGEKK